MPRTKRITIEIIGAPGAGKTTIARAISNVLGQVLPNVRVLIQDELDSDISAGTLQRNLDALNQDLAEIRINTHQISRESTSSSK